MLGSLFLVINLKLTVIQIILQIQFLLCKEQFASIKTTGLLVSDFYDKDGRLL